LTEVFVSILVKCKPKRAHFLWRPHVLDHNPILVMQLPSLLETDQLMDARQRLASMPYCPCVWCGFAIHKRAGDGELRGILRRLLCAWDIYLCISVIGGFL